MSGGQRARAGDDGRRAVPDGRCREIELGAWIEERRCADPPRCGPGRARKRPRAAADETLIADRPEGGEGGRGRWGSRRVGAADAEEDAEEPRPARTSSEPRRSRLRTSRQEDGSTTPDEPIGRPTRTSRRGARGRRRREPEGTSDRRADREERPRLAERGLRSRDGETMEWPGRPRRRRRPELPPSGADRHPGYATSSRAREHRLGDRRARLRPLPPRAPLARPPRSARSSAAANR